MPIFRCYHVSYSLWWKRGKYSHWGSLRQHYVHEVYRNPQILNLACPNSSLSQQSYLLFFCILCHAAEKERKKLSVYIQPIYPSSSLLWVHQVFQYNGIRKAEHIGTTFVGEGHNSFSPPKSSVILEQAGPWLLIEQVLAERRKSC